MPDAYAAEFAEVPFALANNGALRARVVSLIAGEPMPGKATEGHGRVERVRAILTRVVNGELTVADSTLEAEASLPPTTSLHAGNARVFPSGWAERLVRTQLSRFYNQAVLEALLANGEALAFVPHSSEEGRDSRCTQLLAGRAHDARELHDRLVRAYGAGDWSVGVKVPDHLHCTHVVAPVE